MTIAALLVLAGVAYLLHVPLLQALARPLVEDDGPQKADCILVLGGDAYGERLFKAARLAVAGYAPYVLVDGPKLLMGHETDETIPFTIRRGFSPKLFEPIALPDPIDSTRDESAYVANRILKPRNIHKILLVTSSFHTARAARIMRRKAPWLWVVVVSAPDPNFRVEDWWRNREGKKIFFYEWMKTIAEWWNI